MSAETRCRDTHYLYDDIGWKQHPGGLLPVAKGTRVDIRHRNKGVYLNLTAGGIFGMASWRAFASKHEGYGCEIVEYRESPKPTKEGA